MGQRSLFAKRKIDLAHWASWGWNDGAICSCGWQWWSCLDQTRCITILFLGFKCWKRPLWNLILIFGFLADDKDFIEYSGCVVQGSLADFCFIFSWMQHRLSPLELYMEHGSLQLFQKVRYKGIKVKTTLFYWGLTTF